MKIVHVASEVGPFSQTGGLSNVTSKLPEYIAEEGIDISVFSPLYMLSGKNISDLETTGFKATVMSEENSFEYEVYTTKVNGVTHYLFRNHELFGRRGVYGTGGYDFSDNDIRFGTFCQACLKFIKYNMPDVDIIQTHEWQTALIPVYKNLLFNELKAKTVLTIHDIANQGIFQRFSIDALNLPWEVYDIDIMEYFENINFLKGGIYYADKIVMVSKGYLEDIQNDEYSAGLEGVINSNIHKFTGIFNGIDYGYWNPATDPFISHNYSVEDICPKIENKKELCAQFGLDSGKPLFAVISRFSHSGGMDTLLEMIEEMEQLEANFVILGYGDARYSAKFQVKGQGRENIVIKTGFDQVFLHKVYSAMDFNIVPAVYLPCGDRHVVAMRYGALPIGRCTGGFKDTVKDIDDGGWGLIIDNYSKTGFIDKINIAIDIFNNSVIFLKYVEKAMQKRFSWEETAKEYIEMYNSIFGGK